MSATKGVFHVIATPIGNLADITQRAIDVIGQLDTLYAEDTRHTARLCSQLGLAPRLRSLHEHNEEQRVTEILELLRDEQAVGLVSDAGTPLISDPGYRVIAACHEEGLPVSPVPGVSAVTAALSVCGLPTDQFLFSGFLPAKSQARLKALFALKSVIATLVFYESKHRIVDTLNDIEDSFGDRTICLGRELTKTFETIKRGRVSTIREQVAANPDSQKGEFVLIVSGAKDGIERRDISLQHQALMLDLVSELPVKSVAKIMAPHCGLPKRAVYDWLLEQKGSSSSTKSP